MFQVYLFFLVLCGGLALLSIVGDFMDADVGDADVGLDVGADAGLDADFDADLDPDAELDLEAEAGAASDAGGETEVGADAEKIFSIRGGLYAGFGFGLVGTALTAAGSAPGSPVTLGLSVTSGLGAGWLVTRLIGWIRSTEAGDHAPDRTFEGRAGRMTLPISEGSTGRVRVLRGTRTHDLRALPHPASPADSAPGDWEEVLVVEVKDGVALVTPVDPDEFDQLTSS